jgi:HD-GYP domain-containing protein (c-di-GMP phosphodiesterase class II)
MKAYKTRSIRKAAFFSMLGGSLIYVLLSFIMLSVFIVTLTYLLVDSHERNLSEVLVNNYEEKQGRITNISTRLAEKLSNGISESEKQLYLEASVNTIEDIRGIFILNSQGIITDATRGYKEFLGLDYSGKDYYKQIVNDKTEKYVVPNAYVSHKTKTVSLNVVSPIVRQDSLEGMVVMLINPNIVENQELKDLYYYLVDSNGDIIFHSKGRSVVSSEDNIKDSSIMSKGINSDWAVFYRDKVTGKLVLGNIKRDDSTGMYIVVNYDIFDNKALFDGLLVILGITILVVMAFIFIFSSEVARVITNYINIFKNQLKKIASGDYDIKLSSQYPHEEINEIIQSFTKMSLKIKQREEELQAYNEELVAANDEIKSMYQSLNRNEKEKREQYLQIIWTMVNLLEIKDEYTAGHSRAVTFYTEKIAENLNLNYGFNLDVERIQMAASLHDIGKIGIQGAILNKPTKLTKEEYESIKTHPSKGYYALKDIASLKEERRIIKYHHERYDGLGYPEGIKGDNIPLGARIICVADSFDAMISDRPYRKGMSIDSAIQELVKNRGTQFDPLIVDVFVEMLRKGYFEAAQTEAQ